MIITPSWTIEEIENLDYNLATIDPLYLKDYIEAGHSVEALSIQNYFENQVMPDSILRVKENFDWKDCTVAVNFLKPGQYLPLHSDLYKRYMEVHGITDLDSIHRAVIMTEDSYPGQYLEINDQVINKWTAGQTFFWNGTDKHAAYNFSTRNRYAIQVTGWDGL